MDVSVRELKNSLSRYLRRVQQGESVLVTSRGKPVAHLVPLTSVVPEAERLEALPGVDAGSGGKPQGAHQPARVEPGQKSVSEIVLEERR